MESHLSISYYERLKPYLAHFYQDVIQYDTATKTWIALETEKPLAIEEEEKTTVTLSELCPDIKNLESN